LGRKPTFLKPERMVCLDQLLIVIRSRERLYDHVRSADVAIAIVSIQISQHLRQHLTSFT